MGAAEMKKLAAWMDEIVAAPGDETRVKRVAGEIGLMVGCAICRFLPVVEFVDLHARGE